MTFSSDLSSWDRTERKTQLAASPSSHVCSEGHNSGRVVLFDSVNLRCFPALRWGPPGALGIPPHTPRRLAGDVLPCRSSAGRGGAQPPLHTSCSSPKAPVSCFSLPLTILIMV